MSHRRLGWLLAWMAAAPALDAQGPPGRTCYAPGEQVLGRTTEEWARRFAPILRFADAEFYFPTLPWFAAFDGIDNPGSTPGAVDFADATEIAPPVEGRPGLVDWGRIHEWYAGRGVRDPVTAGMVAQVLHPVHERAPRVHDAVDTLLAARQRRLDAAAVGYRVCRMDRGESQVVWRYLRSDEQAWRRFQRMGLHSRDLRLRSLFLVVEYYLYYVSDAGLQGHPNDMEGVFALQLLDTLQQGTAQWEGKPVLLIGAGHSELTPNSVVVLSPSDASSFEWVTGFPEIHAEPLADEGEIADHHANVLVELGGHSSAPDIEPYGVFTAGVDVNWHLDDVWGTRDVQAVAGTGFQGPFRYDMEFPRSTSAPVVVPPGVECGDFAPDRACAPYGLVAVDHLRALLDRAADPTVSNAAFREFVNQTFRDSLPPFRGIPDALPDDALTAARAAFGHWRRAALAREGKSLKAAGYLPWRSSKATTHTSDQLKLHLFRPAAQGISTVWDVIRLVDYGVRYETGGRVEPYLGLVVPAFASNVVPFRLPGFLEFQVGRYGTLRDDSNPFVTGLSLLWEHRYVGNVPISYYQRVSWIPRRERAVGDTTAANGSFAAGVSMLLHVTRRKGPFDLVNAVRLRAGLRMDLGHWSDVLRDAGLELSISFRQ
jgi:hypothetical protein